MSCNHHYIGLLLASVVLRSLSLVHCLHFDSHCLGTWRVDSVPLHSCYLKIWFMSQNTRN